MSLYYALLLSAAVSVIAMTITKAVITEPFREKIKKKSEFFGELVSCPYCCSFWIAVPFQLIYKIVLIENSIKVKTLFMEDVLHGLDLTVSYLVIIAFASFISGWIYKSVSQIG